jgi:hypothetical protein
MTHQYGFYGHLPTSDFSLFPPSPGKNRDSQNRTDQHNATQRDAEIKY